MKSHGVVAAGALLVGAACAASNTPGIVKWDIQRQHRRQELTRLGKRADTYEEVITNEEMRGGYFATCQIGTPGQPVTLQLDTGSSDIWVPANTAQVCRQRGSGDGCAFGSFDPDASSTFEIVGDGEFDIAYLDQSFAKGDYITDVFEIGGAVLQNMTMGLGLNTDIDHGLVGVGYPTNEAIIHSTDNLDAMYPNLPIQMVNQGLISTPAYSLWLNDLDASSGNILFGGIDTEKYVGQLTRINVYPTQRDPDIWTSFLVALTSLDAVSPSGQDRLSSRQFPIPVVLDSGTTLSYLPTDIAHQTWREVGAIWAPEVGNAVLPCSLRNSKGYFSFGFAGPSGPRINVTMDELVLDLTLGPQPKFTSGPYRGQEACRFGIQNFTSPPFLLGDTFLRSAYVVYDLINHQIGLAATDFNSTDSNIVPFPSEGAHIPSATPAPDQSQVTQTPSFSTPAYEASPGFTDLSAWPSETDNAAPGSAPAFGPGQVAVVGLTMVLTMLGSGLFVLL
ncbi:hypothetical protein VTJ83DRAFT_693 [Remersonia thermophila]|uniref:Peptidase A1 domain-containing protein n=1 Tax=Remersonia thermophila TaxID=72144 RepID=A0ABR4DNG4_9PEZI